MEEYDIEDLINRIPTLSPEESKSFDGKITVGAGIALKNMKNANSPGMDGFGAECFNCFWKQLGAFVFRALNDEFKDG